MSSPDIQTGCRLMIASLEMRLERLLKMLEENPQAVTSHWFKRHLQGGLNDVREFRRTVERLDTLAAIRERVEQLKGEGK